VPLLEGPSLNRLLAWEGRTRLVRGPLFKGYLLLGPALLLALVYAGTASLPRLLLLFLQLFLYVWWAFFINDVADRDADRAGGKRRWAGELSPAGAWLVGALLIVANGLVAVGLQATPLYWGLLLVTLVGAWSYSAPPLRWKNRGVMGPLGAAVVGQIMPIALVAACYGLFPWWLALVALIEGVKNAIDIVFHQIVDYEADAAGGVRSLAVQLGLARTKATLRRLSVVGILAALTLGGLTAWLVAEYRWVLLGVVVLFPVFALLQRRMASRGLGNELARLMPGVYLWFGYQVFGLLPFWLSLILWLREPGMLPLFLLSAVLALGQTMFYLRYQYR
jgi:4-hydroxybenzoate polyprenyltransferase